MPKPFHKRPSTYIRALGGIVVAVAGVFVQQKQSSNETGRAEVWRKYQDLDNRLDEAEKTIGILKDRSDHR